MGGEPGLCGASALEETICESEAVPSSALEQAPRQPPLVMDADTAQIWWLIGPYTLLTLAFGGSFVPKLNL